MTRIGDVFDRDCPARTVVGHLANHWGSLALGALLNGTMRFGELRRAIGGVSEKMLAQTLQALERDGFVDRRVHPVIPPHVDYTLTPLGTKAAEHIRGLFDLVQDNLSTVLAARDAYDDRRASVSA